MRERLAFIFVSLAILTLISYWKVQYQDFLLWDDYAYVVENPHVRTGISIENIVWSFTSYHASNWHPLTWISHMLDVELYGMNPAGHHWNNLLLHIANTLLLFLFLRNLTGALWRSALVAALFSVHPLHVESVAWVSERKDVLSTFFWMTALIAYVNYVRGPGRKWFRLSLCSFALGLMSKPMVVTLPFVFLLLDFWPLQRMQSRLSQGMAKPASFLDLCREKIPFFALSACACVLTFLIQRASGAVAFEVPWHSRISNALVSYAEYIFMMFRPVNLACFYPHPLDNIHHWQIVGSFLLLSVITFLSFRVRRRHPYLLVGWLWYIGTLFPVIGLVQVGEQAMADRYTYIPLIGLFLMVCWGTSEVRRNRKTLGTILGFSSAALLFILASLTRQQVDYWRDSLTLFQHEVQVNRDSFLAHFHLGTGLEKKGRLEEAGQEYSEALRIRPGFQLGHYHLGNVLAKSGKYTEALHQFSEAVEIDPRDFKSHNNMGFILIKEGRYAEAIIHFSEVLRLHPDDRIARHNLDLSLRKVRESANP